MMKKEQTPPIKKYVPSSIRAKKSKSIEGRKHSANTMILLIKTCNIAIFIHEFILKNIHEIAAPTG